ncbi:MAG: alpha/beta fold hydrolase [bacterium]|nr:alpha/beta fold hydrolase [bacterium]
MPLRRLTTLLLLAALTACTSLHEDLSRQLLRPPAAWLAEPGDYGIAAEPLAIELHSSASLTGWWIPSAEADGRTVVLLHAEDVNTSVLQPYYSFLHAAGYHVLALDPRGFGKSRGDATLRAWLYDLNAVFEWLEARPEVDREKVALYGTSLGSVAALWAARMHKPCRAVVLEHVPSLREMLRETLESPDSAFGAYSLGFLEFSALPEHIEPAENAPRVDARALYITTENELARNRRSLLQAYAAHAGEKRLWVVPATGQAPHAMLTHDGHYQRTITRFLDDAFAGRALAMTPAVEKVQGASTGESWYEIRAGAKTPPSTTRWALEACAMLPDGTARFARTWTTGDGRVRLRLPAAPVGVGVRHVEGAEADDDAAFTPGRTHLTRSWLAVAELWSRIEEVRNESASTNTVRDVAAGLRAASASEPFHPVLEAELADVFARLGLALEDEAWLRRAVAAVPERPDQHFWPGPVATYGYPQAAVVELARQRLEQ